LNSDRTVFLEKKLWDSVFVRQLVCLVGSGLMISVLNLSFGLRGILGACVVFAYLVSTC